MHKYTNVCIYLFELWKDNGRKNEHTMSILWFTSPALNQSGHPRTQSSYPCRWHESQLFESSSLPPSVGVSRKLEFKGRARH